MLGIHSCKILSYIHPETEISEFLDDKCSSYSQRVLTLSYLGDGDILAPEIHWLLPYGKKIDETQNFKSLWVKDLTNKI